METIYRAKDGKEFADAEDCLAHEAKSEELCKNWVNYVKTDSSLESLRKFMEEHILTREAFCIHEYVWIHREGLLAMAKSLAEIDKTLN